MNKQPHGTFNPQWLHDDKTPAFILGYYHLSQIFNLFIPRFIKAKWEKEQYMEHKDENPNAEALLDQIEKLVTEIDQESQKVLEQITAMCDVSSGALRTEGGDKPTEKDLALVLDQIGGMAADLMNSINYLAEKCGADYKEVRP